MKKITKNIDLNVSQPNNYQLVHAMQGNNNTVEIVATIWNGNKPYSIDSDSISLEWQSPSGSKKDFPIMEHTGHTVTFLLSKEMLAENGDYSFCIRFDNSGNDMLRTFCSTMRVVKAPFGQLMDSEFVTLTELVNEAKSYYNKMISEKGQLPNAMTTNLLYIEPFYRIPPDGGMGFSNGIFSCSVTDENVTVWSGEIDLPDGGYAYPASSDSAHVLVAYTLDGVEHQVEISSGAVLPEGAVVTKYYLERKEGESRLHAFIYPMISPTKSPVSEFVSYTGDATKLNECLSDIVCPVYDTPATRSNLKSGEKLNNAFGKISKFFSDLKAVAFTGSYNDLKDKPNEGYVLRSAVVHIPDGAPPSVTHYAYGDFHISGGTVTVGSFEELVVVSVDGFPGFLYGWWCEGEDLRITVLKVDEGEYEATIYYFTKG